MSSLNLFGPARIRRYLWGLAIFWTLLVFALFAWDFNEIKEETLRLAENNARANFDKDQAFRHWATQHGGVYVPVSEHTPPNPFLKHVPERDIRTPSGKQLTLMNPAYMVRQLNEDFAKWFGAEGHITSLKLLREENAPDAWETRALKLFEQGVEEVSEVTRKGGHLYMRLMRPMIAEKGCLKCHGHQGYEVGDIRGGVSVTIPIRKFLSTERHQILFDGISFGSLWLFGLMGLGGAGKRLTRYESELRASEQKFHSVFDDALDMIHICDRQARILDANRMELETLGYRVEEYAGKRYIDLVHPDYREQTQREIRRVFEGEKVTGLETVVMTRSGKELFVEVNMVPEVIGGKVVRIRSISRDVTARRNAENALRRINRELVTLSSGNQALVRAQSEQELLDSICQVLVEKGGFQFAWVGFAADDAIRGVTPMSSFGRAKRFLDEVPHGWGEDDYGNGPVGLAIKKRRAYVVHDLFSEPSFAPWQEAARRYSYRSMIALPLMEGGQAFGVLTLYSRETTSFDEAEIDLLTELAGDLAYGLQVIRTRQQRDEAQGALGSVLMETVDAIARTVETRDPYTAGHQHRVSELAVAIAKQMGLNEFRVEGLRLGSLLHDLGKVAIPAEILTRPGQLQETEFELIKAHPKSGYAIVRDVPFPWPVKEMVLQHHERIDGSGYPDGLKKEEIILEARILAVADVVEAITSHRPYRPALGIDVALDEIKKGRGKIYCEDVVDACLAVFEEGLFRLVGRIPGDASAANGYDTGLRRRRPPISTGSSGPLRPRPPRRAEAPPEPVRMVDQNRAPRQRRSDSPGCRQAG